MDARLQDFSAHLFWDVDRNAVDIEQHSPFLVQRVLEYGEMSDWKLLQQIYGLTRIFEVTKSLRSLDPKALSYISTISHTPITEFRCYTQRQLSRAHWIY